MKEKTQLKKRIILNGSDLKLEDLAAIAAGAKITLVRSARKRVNNSRKIVESALKKDMAVYGVNTGFGYLANEKISSGERAKLQKNILRSHAAGWGDSLPVEIVRVAMVLRLNLFLKGFSGVRWELVEMLYTLISKDIYPVVPEYGSVGASGDLIPLAHIGLALIGEGKVLYRGKTISAKQAFKKAGLTPLVLAEKEGLGFVNGTDLMLSVGAIALIEGFRLVDAASKVAAMSFEALKARPSPLHPAIHRARTQLGQIEIARAIRSQLKSSYLYDSETAHPRLQDPYSLRCVPQVHGASLDALKDVRRIVERELAAITDNPIVLPREKKIVSGGNFHGQYLALYFDLACMAVAELGSISERRLELLLNPEKSGLSPFLAGKPGVESGMMALQYLAASLVNENKILSHPASTDSIPGNVGIEDHVSMGMTSARKFARIVKNTEAILACEFLASAQAIDLLRKRKERFRLGVGTRKTLGSLRRQVKPLGGDRELSGLVEKARQVLSKI